jgi:NtrC-family two-component system response regulator AlgB
MLSQTDPQAEADLSIASGAMARALELARTAARSNAAVLIRGEGGSGKGRLARAIHGWSTRCGAPLVAVSCQADSSDDLEAELFGAADREGQVDECAGGTLVLEGVSNLPMPLQVKLLRLLREREYERQEDFRPRPANVRVIATTAVDLESLAQRGQFRDDLLAALQTIRIDLPPLRHRPEDLELLAQVYVAHFARECHRPAMRISEQAMQVLREHRWPGNVRELRNVLERAVQLCRGEMIGLDSLPPNLLNLPGVGAAVGDLVSLETIEQLHIRKVVASLPTIAAAAAVLGVHPGTVLRRLKKHPTPESAIPLDLSRAVDSPATP